MVQMRTRIMSQLQALAMNEGKGWKSKLWSQQGRAEMEKLALAPWASRRRRELLELFDRINPTIEELTAAVEQEAQKRPDDRPLMTHPRAAPHTPLPPLVSPTKPGLARAWRNTRRTRRRS